MSISTLLCAIQIAVELEALHVLHVLHIHRRTRTTV